MAGVNLPPQKPQKQERSVIWQTCLPARIIRRPGYPETLPSRGLACLSATQRAFRLCSATRVNRRAPHPISTKLEGKYSKYTVEKFLRFLREIPTGRKRGSPGAWQHTKKIG